MANYFSEISGIIVVKFVFISWRRIIIVGCGFKFWFWIIITNIINGNVRILQICWKNNRAWQFALQFPILLMACGVPLNQRLTNHHRWLHAAGIIRFQPQINWLSRLKIEYCKADFEPQSFTYNCITTHRPSSYTEQQKSDVINQRVSCQLQLRNHKINTAYRSKYTLYIHIHIL